MISNELSIQNPIKNSKTIDILAVDDQPDNLFLMQVVLEDEAAYSLTCVDSGEAALNEVSNSLPDLILLDVMMPGMTGYEVTERIRKNPETAKVPILLVTAHDGVEETDALALGANGLIKKPVEIDELLSTVRNMTQQVQQLREPVAAYS